MQATVESLYAHYREINRVKFDGILPSDYRITFNPFLRRLTGRITYRDRLIEISSYHFRQYGIEDAKATLEHEMLHLYLRTLGRPSGHNALFKKLAEQLQIRVFHANPYPQNRAPRHRYLLRCPSCERHVFRKRYVPANPLACGICCREKAEGRFDTRFALQLMDKVRFA